MEFACVSDAPEARGFDTAQKARHSTAAEIEASAPEQRRSQKVKMTFGETPALPG